MALFVNVALGIKMESISENATLKPIDFNSGPWYSKALRKNLFASRPLIYYCVFLFLILVLDFFNTTS